jgi:uncharacterized protein (TIGR01244 family)
MKKSFMLMIIGVGFATAVVAEDQAREAVDFLKADEIRMGKLASTDARFVSSGQPDEASLRAIADAGFTTIVDLRTESEDHGLNEPETVERLGMTYVTLPIKDSADVTFDNAATLDRILVDHEGRILLHCGSGNRVGALFALREKMLGASSEEALATGKAAGLTRLEPVVTERLAE